MVARYVSWFVESLCLQLRGRWWFSLHNSR